MIKKQFSIQPPQQVGISDKLWHLYVLYKLGVALSYQYVHIPFNCPRSYRTTLIHRLLGNLSDRIFAISSCRFHRMSYRADRLTQFLGLDSSKLNLNQQLNRNRMSLIRIDLDVYFSQHASFSLEEIRNFIERHQSNRLNSTYLLSTNGLYNAYPALESLISPFRDGVNSGNLRLSERYWLRNKRPPIGFPKEDAPLKIAIHLRRGDRTLIRTAQSLISVFADTAQKIRLEEQINSSENLELQNTQLVSIIDQLNAHLETENCTIFVLTDGTNRTFYCVLKKLLSGGLRLPIREAVAVFKKLYVLSTFLEKDLRLHPNVHLITGESRRTLFQSIHALVIADVVILTSGGFAYWIHTFLKPLGKASVIVKLDDFSESTIKLIQEKCNR